MRLWTSNRPTGHEIAALFLLCAGGLVFAQESADRALSGLPTQPDLPFRQTAPGVFELGQVTIDKKRRAVSFPAAVNQREGTVEYAVVTSSGKTHESIFKTDAAPQHIHLAMLLLDAKPAQTNAFPADLSLPLPGDKITIDVSWKANGAERRRALEDFVLTANNQRTLSHGPWIYNGSWVAEGGFVAQRDGSIVSIHIDPDALVNNPRPGRENDDLHHVNGKALPPDDVPVRVTFKLESAPAPAAVSPGRASSEQDGGPRRP